MFKEYTKYREAVNEDLYFPGDQTWKFRDLWLSSPAWILRAFWEFLINKSTATDKSCANASFLFQLTFARFYLPILVPSAKKAIYMDDDVIVQGTKECHHQCCSLSSVGDSGCLIYDIL